MSRYIKVEDAIEAAINGCADWDGGYFPSMDEPIKDAISSVPTVDAVQIVRCKDCLHHTDVEPYDHECELIPSNAVFCQHFAVVRDKDWFCADGERGSDDKS